MKFSIIDLFSRFKLFFLNNPFYLGLLVLIIPISGFFVQLDNIYIRVHDNFDITFTNLQFIANHQHFFNFDPKAIIEQTLNGLPRGVFNSMFYIPSVLFYLFESNLAYSINAVLIILVAYIGMYRLINDYLLKNHDSSFIALGVSLSFAILPTYYVYGISVVGIPLLCVAILNFYYKDHSKWDYLILTIYPFYSYFALTGIFVLIVLSLFLVCKLMFGKKWSQVLFNIIFYLTCLNLIVDFQLFYTIFINTDFDSIRSHWPIKQFVFLDSVKEAVKLALYGQYHAASKHFFILLIVVPLAYFSSFVNKNEKLIKTLNYLLIVQFLIVGFYFYWNSSFSTFIKTLHPIFVSFEWGRFYWLIPTIIYSIFSISLYLIMTNTKSALIAVFPKTKNSFIQKFDIGKYFVILIVFCQIMYILKGNKSFYYTFQSYLGTQVLNSNSMTIKQFYSPNLFDDIKKFIGKPLSEYKVVSFGLFPSIALYNGFNVLDGYLIYSQTYKNKFRKVISDELSKSKKWQMYFDNWGQRCYIFSEELDELHYIKGANKNVEALKINSEQLYEMGGRYIISAVNILNHQDIGLKFHDVFSNKNSAYEIFLYEIRSR